MSPPHRFTLLQVTPRLDAGGVERTTVDVAAAVVAAGGRALVASAGGRLEDELAGAGGELIRLRADSKKLFTLAGVARQLRRIIVDERVSIVHARSRAPAFAAGWAARAERTPFVTTYAGIYSGGSAIKRWYNGAMARADLVIANSEFTREHLLAQHHVDPQRVIAIPRGIDLARFDPAAVRVERIQAIAERWRVSPDENRPGVLLAGRLTSWKGQGLMVDALTRMQAAGAELPLVIMTGDTEGGSGWGVELEGRIVRAGLARNVKLVGHTQDMPAAYLACDLAVAPSLRPEAFGRTAVEPQAMGRPVLAADHGGARETVEDGVTGWRVKPRDAEAWAEALIAALAAGPHAWDRMGRAGFARARRLYSLEAMTTATLEAYARLLRGD